MGVFGMTDRKRMALLKRQNGWSVMYGLMHDMIALAVKQEREADADELSEMRQLIQIDRTRFADAIDNLVEDHTGSLEALLDGLKALSSELRVAAAAPPSPEDDD